MVDSVEEGLQASRRFMLLYNASTFGTKRETSNNNNIIISKDSIISHGAETETGDISSSTGFIYDDGSMYPEQRQQFEVAAGMHRALLEASLKVKKSISSAVSHFHGENFDAVCSLKH